MNPPPEALGSNHALGGAVPRLDSLISVGQSVRQLPQRQESSP
jgi:hypothetical protein